MAAQLQHDGPHAFHAAGRWYAERSENGRRKRVACGHGREGMRKAMALLRAWRDEGELPEPDVVVQG
jgi:hypothetical protein